MFGLFKSKKCQNYQVSFNLFGKECNGFIDSPLDSLFDLTPGNILEVSVDESIHDMATDVLVILQKLKKKSKKYTMDVTLHLVSIKNKESDTANSAFINIKTKFSNARSDYGSCMDNKYYIEFAVIADKK